MADQEKTIALISEPFNAECCMQFASALKPISNSGKYGSAKHGQFSGRVDCFTELKEIKNANVNHKSKGNDALWYRSQLFTAMNSNTTITDNVTSTVKFLFGCGVPSNFKYKSSDRLHDNGYPQQFNEFRDVKNENIFSSPSPEQQTSNDSFPKEEKRRNFKWAKTCNNSSYFPRGALFILYLLLLVILYQNDAQFQTNGGSKILLSLMHKITYPLTLSGVCATSFNGQTNKGGRDHNYGARDILNIHSHSVDYFSPSYDLHNTATHFQSRERSELMIDNNQKRNNTYLSSFSSSPYDPKSDINILQRTFNQAQLKQLYRSAGCVNDEIKLVSIA